MDKYWEIVKNQGKYFKMNFTQFYEDGRKKETSAFIQDETNNGFLYLQLKESNVKYG